MFVGRNFPPFDGKRVVRGAHTPCCIRGDRGVAGDVVSCSLFRSLCFLVCSRGRAILSFLVQSASHIRLVPFPNAPSSVGLFSSGSLRVIVFETFCFGRLARSIVFKLFLNVVFPYPG
ncbi:unnamed protein product, partial [Sphacelaria rigidula]